MDVRKRLNLGDEMPPELMSRKTKVFETLSELKKEVKPIEEATETLKDTDSMKDSKTFLNVLQKKFHVSVLCVIWSSRITDWHCFMLYSFKWHGLIVPIEWENISMSAASIWNQFPIYTFVCWSCNQLIRYNL